MTDAETYYTRTAVSTLKGIGAVAAAGFAAHGVHTLFDMLVDLPFRYLDRTRITRVGDIAAPGGMALMRGKVQRVTSPGQRMRVTKVTLCDDSGQFLAVFFNLNSWLSDRLRMGATLTLFGRTARDMSGLISLQHPEICPDGPLESRLTPVYHSYGKLKPKVLRDVHSRLLERLSSIRLTELIPSDLNPFGMDINEALREIHAPLPAEGMVFWQHEQKSFKRLCYEELIAYQISLLSVKAINGSMKSTPIRTDGNLQQQFTRSLPFSLTGAQERVLGEICADLQRTTPMLRLLQGDVGSGKTLVAVMASLQVARQGMQSVVLAPTELLAQQHLRNFCKYLEPFGVNVVGLYSAQSKAERAAALAQIGSGAAKVIVGTHSVFQSAVIYNNLVFAIIDEQHRFGIEQRTALLRKAPSGITPHQLVMTATPIPRTQQLAMFADLDVSELDELPAGRAPVQTSLVADNRRQELIEHLQRACAGGIQAYWVCPRIEQEDEDDISSVKVVYDDLQKFMPGLRIGLIHGQLKPDEKDAMMSKFIAHEIDVLVATTIIEVGVDVPNANIMIIENAGMLGLAQLHQLRGRVGRGHGQGYCILMYKAEETGVDDLQLARLRVLKNTSNGFVIAQEDLRLRGPGEVFGTRQTGFSTFRLFDLGRDQALVPPARRAAEQIMRADQQASRQLVARWFPGFSTR